MPLHANHRALPIPSPLSPLGLINRLIHILEHDSAVKAISQNQGTTRFLHCRCCSTSAMNKIRKDSDLKCVFIGSAQRGRNKINSSLSDVPHDKSSSLACKVSSYFQGELSFLRVEKIKRGRSIGENRDFSPYELERMR